MFWLLVVVIILVGGVLYFLRQPPFGAAPSGARLARIAQSPNYRNGKFQNLSPTPDLAEGVSYARVMRQFFFEKSARSAPAALLPSRKTDLRQLSSAENVIVWLGHSSYFLQLDGKRILVDPVLSGSASPLPFGTRSFAGSDVYTVADLPPIDYLFISHDHWDHLDYATVKQLQPSVKQAITGLGTGAHLERWGYNPKQVVELDWYETHVLAAGFVVRATPARHFSGRSLSRNRALWISFVLQTPSQRIYLGGDSGYDTHFKAIGDAYGPFDLAILECGQYNQSWKYIHMMPEEVVQAAFDLRARVLLPVHWAKFTLALHAWDEPIQRVTAEATRLHLPVLHPLIGEAVKLQEAAPPVAWWNGL
ncbi:MBL fold metallo-hydrolase [Hymenobacter jejuensis]|uniref:MBL fold metallo-hydrolase n=1 Tax=Hymenobacter jejuensis TaxID=2502781 RepID=A0A5B7ZYS1_9BACT|nr:MBL fold metallo-hydrolase [Hymenobacter jejuensis]QDA60130.1 MBL fold metallo-hydrolase [Hymenobacter jejuensis]